MDNLLENFIQEAEKWIVSENNIRWEKGLSITPKDRILLDNFFQSQTLNSVRICKVSTIENPPFYRQIIESGQEIPLDFSDMDGITFINTILISERIFGKDTWLPLLFHECVHVVQYRLLSPSGFIQDYVKGWALGGGNYFMIPLEMEAYFLQNKFEENQKNIFSVESEVQNQLQRRQVH